MRKNFCGWYYKCQSDTQTLAVIPATHGGRQSVQIITDSGVWSFSENLENCLFGSDGFRLNLYENGVSAVGEVRFSGLTPLKNDIMGPFKFVPFMQCRHSVVSMRHRVDGEIIINGEKYSFSDGLGYIEGDRGFSFPSKYLWTQNFFGGGSLMLSVADIPFAGRHFTGVIAAVLLNGKEYRLATYLGARAVEIADGKAVIRQGGYTLSARLIEMRARALKAPVSGSMVRTVHESPSCRAAYRFEKNGKILLELQTDRASFEYEYGGENEQISK